jgi:GMP synthase-like glutamine amidotransferase
MTLHLAVLQHEAETGLGAFAAHLDVADVDYSLVRTTSGALPDADRFDGAIALGGSLGAYDPRLLETRRWIRNAVLRGLPFFGVSLGGQLLSTALGAAVTPGRPEAGLHDVFLTDAAEHDPLFVGLPRRFEVFGWHEDSFDLAPGAVPLAGSPACTYQAFRFGAAAYGIQFHAEVRVEDLVTWRDVPGYRALADRAGIDFDDLAVDLRHATGRLDSLAGQLVERWIYLVAGTAALAARHHVAA